MAKDWSLGVITTRRGKGRIRQNGDADASAIGFKGDPGVIEGKLAKVE